MRSMANPTGDLTANEAATVTHVPLRQVHRIVDSGLLRDGVRTKGGVRAIERRALVGLRLAHLTASQLTLAARRRLIGRVLREPDAERVREASITVDVGTVAHEVRCGLELLGRAQAAVVSDPEILGGIPCIAGARVPVHDLADLIANGESLAAVLAAYPALSAEQVELATVYAAAYPRRGRPPSKPAGQGTAPIRSTTLRIDDLPLAS